MVVEMLLRVNT